MHGFVNLLKGADQEGGFIKQERNCMRVSSEMYVYIYSWNLLSIKIIT